MSSEEESDAPVTRRNRPFLAFAKDLKAGERPSIDDYLAQAADLEQPELLPELV